MPCQFTRAVAARIKERHDASSLSIFNEYEGIIDDLQERAKQAVGGRTATQLRMFFWLEVCQFALRLSSVNLIRECELNSVAIDLSWLERRYAPTTFSLKPLLADLELTTERLSALNFEMKVQRHSLELEDHVNAELYSKNLGPQFQNAVNYFKSAVAEFLKVLSRAYPPGVLASKVIATYFIWTLNELSYNSDNMTNVYNYLSTITDTETVSPWTTKLPIFPE